MPFVGKSLCPSATVDKESYYSVIETRYLFTPDEKTELIQKVNSETFIQFSDQTSAILRIRYYMLKNLMFQHLSVEDDVILDRKTYKDGNRL